MELDLASGLIPQARYLPSANFDSRPAAADIEALIIHAISLPPSQFGGDDVARFFTNALDFRANDYYGQLRQLRVSSHFYIQRHGELLQFVPTLFRAWHAGESRCLGRTGVNDFSIGIELEGCDTETFTEKQYQVLLQLSRVLMSAYPKIRVDHIFGHEHIAPERKTDPGPWFDWYRYLKTLAGVKFKT